MADNVGEIRGETRWVSYAELAAARGIDRFSAVRIVRMKRWPKQKGNDGTIRVAVPQDFLDAKKQLPREVPGEITPEISRKIVGLEGRVEMLTELLDRERGQVSQLTEAVAQLREQRAAAEATAAAERARADQATADLQAERTAAAEERARLLGLLHQNEAPIRPRWWKPRFRRRRRSQ